MQPKREIFTMTDMIKWKKSKVSIIQQLDILNNKYSNSI